MGTYKDELQVISDNNITDLELITPDKHRTVNDSIINQLYDEGLELLSSAANDYLAAASNTNYPYGLKFTKTTRRVFVDGFIRNATTSIQSNTTLGTFDITDFILLPDDGYVYRGTATNINNGDVVRVIIAGGLLRISGNFPVGTFQINQLSYNSKY